MWKKVLTLITGWEQYFGTAKGIKLDGDLKVPPTTRWNNLYLKWRVWDKISILAVPEDKISAGYRIGYRPFKGAAMVKLEVLREKTIAVLNGREDCRFFAENLQGEEVELTLVKQTGKHDPEYGWVRLI